MSQKKPAVKKGGKKPKQPRRRPNRADFLSRSLAQENRLLSRDEFFNLEGQERQALMKPLSVAVGAAQSAVARSSKPRITRFQNGSIRVVHRELFAGVSGSTAFTIQNTIQMNPGLVATFPWLANIANNYEGYRFNRLHVRYLTRTGSNIPGSMMIIPDYDSADAAPTSEQVASSYAQMVEDAPWKDILAVLSPASMHAIGPQKFVRSGSLAPNLDIKTYDACQVFLATDDGTVVNWGKVWLEYDVTFFTPQLNDPLLPGALVFAATGTAASFMIPATRQVFGRLVASIVGNVVTLQGLTANREYIVQTSTTAGAFAVTYSALVGIVAVTNPLLANATTSGFTFTAQDPAASLATFTATWGGNVTNPIMTIIEIPVLPGF